MVKQQRSGNLKGRVNFCMPWTSSSLSINRLTVSLQFLLKYSWFRQNPTAEGGNIPLITKHNTWILPPACLQELCKERMHLCPLVLAGAGEAQPGEEPCTAEPGLGSQFWGSQWDNSFHTQQGSRIPATCPGTASSLTSTTHPPTRTKGLLISFGVALSLWWHNQITGGHTHHSWVQCSVEPMLISHTVHQS